MYLWGVPKEPGSVSQVYRAIADGPGGPWVADVEPVVPAGEAGEVDDRGLDFPSVVPAGDAWLMTYGANGGDHPNAARVLAARSADGISWEKLGRVMEPMDCGGSDLDFLSNPRTFGSGAGYLTLAVLGNDIAALTSADGLTWECPANGPLFRATEIEGSDRVHTMAAAMDDAGKISVIIEALQYDAQGEVYSNLWLAEVVP
jgi:hypothetical protein